MVVLGGGAVSYERGTPVGVSARPARLWERTADEAQEEAAGQEGQVGGGCDRRCLSFRRPRPTLNHEQYRDGRDLSAM